MTGTSGAGAARQAADRIRDRLQVDGPPVAAIVLGSGLGGLADRIEQPRRVSYAEVPGFPPSTVEGHAGVLIAGRLAGRPVVAMAGRFHLYEGHSARVAGFPVRVLRALGADVLVLSNAAGGVNRTFRPGDLMVIADHANLTGLNPLEGMVEEGDVRFPDMSEPYDAGLRALMHASAAARGVALREGVYAALLGPTYETPAEVRMLERLGADAVGMSTVPETIVARAMGMRVAGVSCITNLAAGISPEPLSHDEVLATTRRVASTFEGLIEEFVRRLP